MKAKIKETGEIVDVYHEPQHGQTANIYKESVFTNVRIWTEDELVFLDASEGEEVDLKKELEILDSILYDLDGVAVKGTTSYLTVEDVKDIGKHFFELGLKFKSKRE